MKFDYEYKNDIKKYLTSNDQPKNNKESNYTYCSEWIHELNNFYLINGKKDYLMRVIY